MTSSMSGTRQWMSLGMGPFGTTDRQLKIINRIDFLSHYTACTVHNILQEPGRQVVDDREIGQVILDCACDGERDSLKYHMYHLHVLGQVK